MSGPDLAALGFEAPAVKCWTETHPNVKCPNDAVWAVYIHDTESTDPNAFGWQFVCQTCIDRLSAAFDGAAELGELGAVRCSTCQGAYRTVEDFMPKRERIGS